ncbi:hypothetical protein EW146_g1521 [Bondarzewia mesenterica]|uniref:DRBM domain-containing protein n=1 Tax=Bondarzewia mesenterica TaxID=1095465 RepID=A0A4S4M3M4_9AGAM|nr:hypothetical protein EW146_g1521 [Bondarzewia mesenterica]
MADFVVLLNNHLQTLGTTRELRWQFEESGLKHQRMHTAVALYYDNEIGKGTGNSKSQAKLAAAAQALNHLTQN